MNAEKKPWRLLLFVMVYASVCMLMQTDALAQSWYNSAWGYRKSVTVDNTGNPSTLTFYQVKVVLSSSNFDFSKAQSGGQDIRFTTSDGTTLIDHWIENWDNAAQKATIWTEVPSVPGSGSAVIYMYFGNPSATDASNGDSTFILFDDFSKLIVFRHYGPSQRIVIDNYLDGAHNVLVENVDGDNKPDIVADGYRAQVLVWYKQPTDPINGTWTKYTIDNNLTNAHDCEIGDIDGDGLRDITALSLSASWQNYTQGDGYLAWYKKPVDPTGPWSKTVIATGLLGVRSSGLGDIDGDGDLDIAVAGVDQTPGKLFWFQNPGGSDALDSTKWHQYLIDNTQGAGADAQIGDIDQDGHADIVYAAGMSGMPTYIYFAPADPTNIPGWQRVSVSGNCYHVYLVDFDGDGDLDILKASIDNQNVTWMENPYPTNPRIASNWHEYVIDTGGLNPRWNRVQAADIDGDGDLDIGAEGNTGNGGTFKWYRRPTDPKDVTHYDKYIIDEDPIYTAYAHDAYLADVDMDGRVDMVGAAAGAGYASNLGNKIVWWRNDTTTTYTYLDASRWENAGGTISNSVLTDSGAGIYTRSKATFQYKALRCKARFAQYKLAGNIGFNYQTTGVGGNDAVFTSGWDAAPFDSIRSLTSSNNFFTFGYNRNEGTDWKIWDILWKSGEVKFAVNDSLRFTHTTNIPTIPLNVDFCTYSGASSPYPNLKIDWTLVRNYSSPEPGLTLGPLESGNRAPVLDSIGPKVVNEGAGLAFRVHATDPDGTTPTLTALNIPTHAAFTDSGNGSGGFIFDPDYAQAGVYNVTFITSDGSLTDSEIVQITVNNVIGQASIIPSFQVDKAGDVDTLWLHLSDALLEVEAATFKITYDKDYITPTSVIDGPDLPVSHLVDAHIYPQDSILIDIGILEGHFDGPGSLVGIVLTANMPVDTTLLSFARSGLRDSSNQDIVHTTQGAAIQIKDMTPPTVSVTSPVSGDTLNYRPTLTVVFHDDIGLNRGYYQIDGCTGSSWTQLWFYNSGSSDTSISWVVPGISQGLHSIHFKVTDDGGNVNADSCSYSWAFVYDTIPPAAPSGFAVLPGHEKCKLSWTNPTDPDFRGMEVRRNPWCVGAYPEYDDYCAALGYPATHTDGDLVYKGLGTSFKDSSGTDVMPRNVYYYTIFSYDKAGNYSTPTQTQRVRATNYWLGDVSGNGEVYFEDLTYFSNAFWTSSGDLHYDAEFDIGPTYDMSPKGIPSTDNLISFEDLVIFAINFAAVGPNQKAVPVLAGQDITGPLGLSLVMPEGGLEAGREFKLQVVLNNNPGTVKAIHFVLPYDPAQLEFTGVDQSAELKGASYPVFFDGRTRDNQVDVSLALLGGNTAIGGSGQIASISFRLLQSKDLSLGFSQIDLRDGENNKLSGQQLGTAYASVLQVPKTYGLSQNYPNPYNLQTQIAYQLPQAGMVLLKIYNIRGELVRTLVKEHKPAGYYTVTWDGKNGDGVAVSSGIYFYRLSSESFSATRKMVMIK